MTVEKSTEQLLQDCVDELFALHEQAQENHKQFVLESATLIKASQKQLSEAVEAVRQTQRFAQQSQQAAKEASDQAVFYRADAHWWKQMAFWSGLIMIGFVVIFTFLAWLTGYKLAQRQADLAALDDSAPVASQHPRLHSQEE